MLRTLARLWLRSPGGCVGARLWVENQADFLKPLSKLQKLLVTAYLVARDTVDGCFPPKGEASREDAYRKEREYLDGLGGVSRAEMDVQGLSKPFWVTRGMDRFLHDFIRIVGVLKENGIHPPARIVELGCGAGWLSELLARCGYDVLGTTLDPKTTEVANRRADALRLLGIGSSLRFRVAPMELLAETISDEPPFDAAIVYEALHHVHDWRESLQQTARVLRPGGLLLVANEPNRIHTLKSYRVAQLTGTHEIGMSRTAIRKHLEAAGFDGIRYPCNRLGFGIRPIWISACKKSMPSPWVS